MRMKEVAELFFLFFFLYSLGGAYLLAVGLGGFLCVCVGLDDGKIHDVLHTPLVP